MFKEPTIEELKNMSIIQLKKKYFISEKKIRELRIINGVLIKRGRPENKISKEAFSYIKNYKSIANVGYQKMSKISLKDPNAPQKLDEWTVRKIFEKEDLYTFLHEYTPNPKDEHPNRFVARYINQAWHTDLHYLDIENEDRKYIISFIDDRSRKIMYHEILNFKNSMSTLSALQKALMIYPKPKMLIFDNGTEFIADNFINYLTENGIEFHLTHPYTPQENGKIERFWKTIEKAKTQPLKEPYLTWLINQYNTIWSNTSLEKFTNQ